MAKLKHHISVIVVLLLLSLCPFNTHADTYYVSPTDNSSCPEDGVSCMTLNDYASLFRDQSLSETVDLILLGGNHSLNTDLTITNITNLSITANTSSLSETIVFCESTTGFQFHSIDRALIRGLTTHRCGGSVANIQDDITFEDCTIEGGTGFQLSSVNSAHIIESDFVGNNANQFNGGALHINTSTVSIADSVFDNNIASYGGAVYATINSSITITNCNFTNNQAAQRGGAIDIEFSAVTIQESTFTGNNYREGGRTILDFGGGAVSLTTTTGLISYSTFSNNTGLRSSFLGSGGGVLVRDGSTATISNCSFSHGSVGYGGGAVGVISNSEVAIHDSMFLSNTAEFGGGAIVTEGYGARCVVEIYGSMFIENRGDRGGGAIAILGESLVNITSSTFTSNDLMEDAFQAGGGAISILEVSVITIDDTMFTNNTAPTGGAIGDGVYCEMEISNSMFISNEATIGGAVLIGYDSEVKVRNTSFIANKAQSGGGLAIIVRCTATLEDCTFTENNASKGAAMIVDTAVVIGKGLLYIENNRATTGVIFAGASKVLILGAMTYDKNYGSVFVYNSEMTLEGETNITRNINGAGFELVEQGGGLTSFRADINFTGTIYIADNEALNGGGILATESLIKILGDVTIAHNRALNSGGGIHAYQSSIEYHGTTNILGNTAANNGGGISAVSANMILIEGLLVFTSNEAAKRGGGIYLESNSKLYINKEEAQCTFFTLSCQLDESRWPVLDFSSNTAGYGGAIFAADNTTSGICSATTETQTSANTGECFYQVLASYNIDILINADVFALQLVINNTRFTNNTARVSGHSLYGGLLDRCTVSPFAEVLIEQRRQADKLITYDAVTYFNVTSNLHMSTNEVSSSPVRVCVCVEGEPDCSYQPPPVTVYKGQRVTLEAVAVDQVNNTIPNTTIRSSVDIPAVLSEGQSVQTTQEGCSVLEYNVFSPNNVEVLNFHADGPCSSIGISITSISIQFLECPIGFEERIDRCECSTELLQQYISDCDINTQSVVRIDNVWIGYINTVEQQGFLTYPDCPFDYCIAPSEPGVTLNLNEPQGEDVQCAFNRSGLLCGQCKDGLSLTLGSSRCEDCSNKNSFLSLLIVFAIAGVALVAFILVFNLTVAVGTINGLIFYANIVGANRAIFFRPFETPNILTVFIAWINLDFGFVTCFVDGLDGYIVTWLQLAFPLYVIFLVAMVITISEYSQRFCDLISNKNPVAALATLILLSYTKFLRVIISVLSNARLEYPDGSVQAVWLVDANITYFHGTRIPLLITAILILLLGLVYTLLIFSWQWLLRFSDKKLLKWVKNTRLNSFMEAYNAPYKAPYRYWTGILLLARALLYLIPSVNIIYDPTVILVSIIVVTGILNLFSTPTHTGLYKHWPLNLLESSFIFNLLIFSVATYQATVTQKSNEDQFPLAIASITIALLTFIGILIYHAYAFVFKHCVHSVLQKFKSKIRIKRRSFLKRRSKPKFNIPMPDLRPVSADSIRLRTRLDLIADEPIVPATPTRPASSQSTSTGVTYAVIDAIPRRSDSTCNSDSEYVLV